MTTSLVSQLNTEIISSGTNSLGTSVIANFFLFSPGTELSSLWTFVSLFGTESSSHNILVQTHANSLILFGLPAQQGLKQNNSI